MFTSSTADSGVLSMLPVLYRRRAFLTAGVLLGLGAAALYTSLVAEPTFTSKAEVLVASVGSEVFSADRSDSLNMATERQLVHSRDLAALVKSRAGWQEDPDQIRSQVDSSVVGESEVLVIAYRDRTAGRARQGAATYAESYLEYRARQAATTRDAARRRILGALADVERRRGDTHRALAAASAGGAADASGDLANSLGDEAARYHSRLADLDTIPVEHTGVVVDAADLPRSPSTPKSGPYSAAGAFLGLTGSTFAVLARHRADPRLRHRSDAERMLGAPVLATVPRWRRPRRADPTPVFLSHPHSPMAESYRCLRTRVQTMVTGRRLQTLMVVSPTDPAGKSAVAANLAVALARAGRTVALVCADLRHPGADCYFAVDHRRGLTDVLAGAMAPDIALQQPAGLDRLQVLPAGSRPTPLVEPLRPERVQTLLGAHRSSVDLVIVDGPPVLSDPEGLLLPSLVDGVLVVADSRTTTCAELEEVRRRLDEVGGAVLGAVICNAAP